MWSIGIYAGKSPFKFAPCDPIRRKINPVLAAKDITDRKAEFVADPFMVKEHSAWHMFFEIMDEASHKGVIGLALSDDCLQWRYKQVVLEEPFHLSYPYVFAWEGEYYMVPDSGGTRSVRLYKAVDFPVKWSFIANLLEGKDFADPSPFYYKGLWWLFVSEKTNDILRLYYSSALSRGWSEHPKSPIVKNDLRVARPAGRVLVYNDRIVRYAQDDYFRYGHRVFAFEITELSVSDYAEEERGGGAILKPNAFGWNNKGMHQIDPHQIGQNKWIACVDGYGFGNRTIAMMRERIKDAIMGIGGKARNNP